MKKLVIDVRTSMGLNLTAWEYELNQDADKEFLLEGNRSGFDIFDSDIPITPVTCINHPSVHPSNPLFHKATEQVNKEKESCNYVIWKKPPILISPMAAIPKPDGNVRITKTRLFKYIENFTSKNWIFSDQKLWYFSYFCSKYRLWVLVRTASARRF